MAKKEIETNKKKETKEVVFITKELKQKDTAKEEYVKVRAFIILVIIILVLIAGLAIVNGNYVTKDLKDNTETTTTAAVSYDSSLLTVDRVFSKSDKEYMVLFYNSNNKTDKDFADEFSRKYTNKDVKLYKVDMASPMNSAYYDVKAEANTKPSKAEDIKINGTTLMTIKKGKVTSYVTDQYEIAKTLSAKEDEK